MSQAIAAVLTLLASAEVLLHTMPARGATLVTNAQEVVSGNTTFATDLYGQLKGGEGNLFFSPYSISTALAMTYGGARGETAQQMANVLHFPAQQEPLHAACAALGTELNAIQ
jgi:serpin B